MFQLLVHHLLIAVVVVCPMLCFGRTTAAVGCAARVLETGRGSVSGAVETPAGCGACCCGREEQRQTSKEQTPQELPEAPSKAPPRLCLCQGAVVAVELRSAELEADLASFAWTPPSQEANSFFSPLAELGTARHFPPGSTGRKVCALASVLLL